MRVYSNSRRGRLIEAREQCGQGRHARQQADEHAVARDQAELGDTLERCRYERIKTCCGRDRTYDEGSANAFRITSYNVCYTKLLRSPV